MTDRELMDRLQEKLGCGPTGASRMLCVAYRRYYSWAKGLRPLPRYIRASIEAHLALPDKAIKALREKRDP